MNNIPPIDLARQYQSVGVAIESAVLEVLSSGRYIGGAPVSDFERQFANYVGTRECVSCNSGTDALFLALRSLDIGSGDEVITTPFTFFATAEVITAVGATPVFVDIEAQTFNFNVEELEAAITPRTKAILPVHLFGQPVNMTRVMEIARSRDLVVIEDCAQATGASWDGQPVGSIGRIGCFSFFPTKNLGAFGDGGAVTTNDRALAEKMRVLKNHGATQRYYHEAIGVNSRLDALQGSILLAKLPYLDKWNDARRTVADRYQNLLGGVADIVLPQEYPGSRSVWNQYTIRVPHRDRLRERLSASGIGTGLYYPVPLHLQPVYRNLGYSPGRFGIVERICEEVLSLPMFPEISLEEQQRVASVVLGE
ncbi:MAG: DegT/DnrJ/EryC1/StrS family aminotransferase [Cyanobacteriota bacterium]|nr:DegT/DnrJ/EryC1/StrS family aminotransferase [Cyanobacteriota bacterium]